MAATEPGATAPRPIRVRTGERRRRHLDLRHLAQREEQLPVNRAMPRFHHWILVVLLPIDGDAPDPIDGIAERLTRVARELHREQHHAEQRDEREEDLQRQQKILALAILDQPQQVTRHRDTPPLSASTGLSRAIRHAGYTPEISPNRSAIRTP